MNLSGEAKAIIGIGLTTLLILVGGIFLLNRSNPTAVNTTTQKVDNAVLIREDSPKIEVANSKVTLVEFLDPECEACKAAHPTVKRVLKDYEGKINFVVRYFPLHNNSMLAAKTLEAAGEQEKYWEMMDILFTRQTEWSEKKEPQTEIFLKYAQELNLDMNKFNEALAKKEYEEKVNRDKNDGIAAGVQGTPTFFINGVKAGNVMSYEEFKTKIDAEL
jgi:protein-disulfide isomerase